MKEKGAEKDPNPSKDTLKKQHRKDIQPSQFTPI